MRARALFGLLGSALLLSAGLGPVALRQDPAPEDPGARRPFIHRDHVPVLWANGTNPETLRDCRGCHDFGEHSTRDPQAVCLECHLQSEENGSTFQAVFSPGWESLDPHRTTGALFQHYAHRELTCRECHQPSDKIPSDPMPIRRGSQSCIRCHGPATSAEELEFEAVYGGEGVPGGRARQSMLSLLNTNPSMLPENMGEFFHSEHLQGTAESFSLEELLDPDSAGRCSSCHESLISSGTNDLHSMRFKENACGECHQTQSGPMTFESSQVKGASLTMGTFSHADHLSFEVGTRDPILSNSIGYERIEESGCHACHQYDASARTFIVDDSRTQQACVTCHDSSRWEAQQHGDWQAWGCLDCHQFTESAALATDRPKATVRRRAGERFEVRSQVHPHIAGGKESSVYEGNCIQCHRAAVADLPSRIDQRRFSHNTHLPKNPSPNSCLRCHGTGVAQAQGSAAIGQWMGDDSQAIGQGLTYDLDACNECHRGGISPMPEVEFELIAERTVTGFSHAAHMNIMDPAGRAVQCMSCHPTDGEGTGDIGTFAGAMDCTSCHDHREGSGAEITGNASAQEIANCSYCHQSEVPAMGSAIAVDRLRIGVVASTASQHHPSDRDCTDCHKAEWNRFGESGAPAGDHVFAQGGRSLLANGELLRHQHRGRDKNGVLLESTDSATGFLRNLGGIDCLWCHWTQGITAYDFESVSNRRKKGRLFEQQDRAGVRHVYPGGRYRELFARPQLGD